MNDMKSILEYAASNRMKFVAAPMPFWARQVVWRVSIEDAQGNIHLSASSPDFDTAVSDLLSVIAEA